MIQLKYLSCIALIFFTASTTVASSQPIGGGLLDEMESLKQQYNLPSLSLAMSIDNKLVFAEAIGHADVEERKKATVDSQYSIGSLDKPMTGIVLAKLADSGKINLESPVSQYVEQPDYTNSFTVRELASHMAGIPHNTPERDDAEFVNPKDHKSPFDAFYAEYKTDGTYIRSASHRDRSFLFGGGGFISTPTD